MVPGARLVSKAILGRPARLVRRVIWGRAAPKARRGQPDLPDLRVRPDYVDRKDPKGLKVWKDRVVHAGRADPRAIRGRVGQLAPKGPRVIPGPQDPRGRVVQLVPRVNVVPAV